MASGKQYLLTRNAFHFALLALNAGVGNRPGHYLCTTEQGKPGCVISIEQGVKPVDATSAEKKLVRKRSFPLYISHRRGLRKYIMY